jgi:hypothetical protein
MMLTSTGPAAVQVVNSTGVTLDSDYINGFPGSGHPALSIDGTSSDVTVSRTYLAAGGGAVSDGAISVASGARNVTITGDALAASGITATDVQGLDVTNNTIQRGCYPAVDVEGASTGVSVENNLFEDANATTDYMMGGFPSQCTQQGHTWDPDVTVAGGSSSATTADYNAFYVYGSDATAPYDWAGTGYPTLAAFRSGTRQGAHDVDDTVEAAGTSLRLNSSANMDLMPRAGSAVIGSADPDAPGKLSTDFFGVSPYDSRGAVQYVNPDPTLAVAMSGADTSAYGITLHTDITSSAAQLNVTTAWGDGTTSSTTSYGPSSLTSDHVYAKLGTYTVTVTVSDGDGNTVTNSVPVETAGSDYTAYGPTRLLDTRSGTGAPKAKVPAHGMVRLKIAGNGAVPADVSAAVLNLTVTNPTTSGFITAYPDGETRPGTSNVNFTAGRTVPNLSLVPVAANGYVDLYTPAAAPWTSSPTSTATSPRTPPPDTSR